MYQHSAISIPSLMDDGMSNGSQDPIEGHVQTVLSELEQLPTDVQVAVCSRLLASLASKLNSAIVGKAISGAKVAPGVAKKLPTKKARATQSTQREDVPRPDSQLRRLNDPTDPLEAWRYFGGTASQLFDVLRQEPMGVLEAMTRHRNMPSGPAFRAKTREKLADEIAVRLETGIRGY